MISFLFNLELTPERAAYRRKIAILTILTFIALC